jgi:hypothetical protein
VLRQVRLRLSGGRSMTNLTGGEYVAVQPIYDKAGRVQAAPGQRCDQVSAEALPWLLAHGKVQLAAVVADEESPRERRLSVRKAARATLASIEAPDTPASDEKRG